MMAKEFDILVMSDTIMDLIVHGNTKPQFQQIEQLVDDYVVELGGSANIFACQFAKLGGRIGVVGLHGTDVLGQILVQNLNEAGVSCDHLKSSEKDKTGITIHLAEPDDRAMLTYLGVVELVGPELFDEALIAQTQHWHIASFFLFPQLRSHWETWLSRLQADGVTTSLDTNWDPEDQWEGVVPLLKHIDVFLPNETEACRIAGVDDVIKAGHWLANQGPLVVIKSGRHGSMAFMDGKCTTQKPLEPIDVCDAIGAGDNFDAGLLRAWLQAAPIEQCLQLASRCAEQSLQSRGGIAGQLVENISCHT
jgi:ribokinase